MQGLSIKGCWILPFILKHPSKLRILNQQLSSWAGILCCSLSPQTTAILRWWFPRFPAWPSVYGHVSKRSVSGPEVADEETGRNLSLWSFIKGLLQDKTIKCLFYTLNQDCIGAWPRTLFGPLRVLRWKVCSTVTFVCCVWGPLWCSVKQKTEEYADSMKFMGIKWNLKSWRLRWG